VYFNVKFNVFFLNKKAHLLVSELYIKPVTFGSTKKKGTYTFTELTALLNV